MERSLNDSSLENLLTSLLRVDSYSVTYSSVCYILILATRLESLGFVSSSGPVSRFKFKDPLNTGGKNLHTYKGKGILLKVKENRIFRKLPPVSRKIQFAQA